MNQDFDGALVERLATTAGIVIPPERLEIVAETLNQFHGIIAEIMAAELEGCEPQIRYDASWPGEAS